MSRYEKEDDEIYMNHITNRQKLKAPKENYIEKKNFSFFDWKRREEVCAWLYTMNCYSKRMKGMTIEVVTLTLNIMDNYLCLLNCVHPQNTSDVTVILSACFWLACKVEGLKFGIRNVMHICINSDSISESKSKNFRACVINAERKIFNELVTRKPRPFPIEKTNHMEFIFEFLKSRNLHLLQNQLEYCTYILSLSTFHRFYLNCYPKTVAEAIVRTSARIGYYYGDEINGAYSFKDEEIHKDVLFCMREIKNMFSAPVEIIQFLVHEHKKTVPDFYLFDKINEWTSFVHFAEQPKKIINMHMITPQRESKLINMVENNKMKIKIRMKMKKKKKNGKGLKNKGKDQQTN